MSTCSNFPVLRVKGVSQITQVDKSKKGGSIENGADGWEVEWTLENALVSVEHCANSTLVWVVYFFMHLIACMIGTTSWGLVGGFHMTH